MSLKSRYTDAYLVVRTIDGTGQAVKVVGLIVAILIALGGFTFASKLGTAFGVAALLLGALVALPFYAMGVLVSAQGQILKASLDSAVQGSPLLSHDEMRQILLGPGGSASGGAAAASERDPAKPDGHCPQCATPFWYADYRLDAVKFLCASCRAELPRPASGD